MQFIVLLEVALRPLDPLAWCQWALKRSWLGEGIPWRAAPSASPEGKLAEIFDFGLKGRTCRFPELLHNS